MGNLLSTMPTAAGAVVRHRFRLPVFDRVQRLYPDPI